MKWLRQKQRLMVERKNMRKYNNKYEKKRICLVKGLIPSATFGNERALDIGCNTGLFTRVLSLKGYSAYGIDIDREKIITAKSLSDADIEFKVADARNLEFPDSFFSLTLCLEVIEHFDNPVKVLDEIYRVTKPNGYLIISTPNKFSLEGLGGKIREHLTGKRWVAWDNTHRKIFSSLEFIKILKDKFFEPINITGYYYVPFKGVTVLDFIRYMSFSKKPLNYFGFDIIVKCVKRVR